MVGVNDPDGTRSANLIMEYSLYLTAFPFVVCALDLTSYMYAVEGVVFNGGLLYLAQKFKQDKSNKNAGKVFIYSLGYILAMMSCFVFHSRRMLDEKKMKNVEQDGVCITLFRI
jgi:heme O synthase-like polyprenyltransferase